MKKTISVLGLCCICHSMYAQSGIQDNSDISGRRNEIGLFTQSNFGSDPFPDQHLSGIQYKRWVRPNIAWRITGGFNPSDQMADPKIINTINQDSALVQYNHYKANVFVLGAGMEIQRQFYKRVHLYASLDVLGGYGSGYRESYTKEMAINEANHYFYSNTPPDYNKVRYNRGFVRLLPSIGGKIVFDKLNFGLETSLANIVYHTEQSENETRYHISEFNLLNNNSIRLFFNYRF